jgi:surface antigen/LysM repeat protein
VLAGARPKPIRTATPTKLIRRSFGRLNKKSKKRLVRFSIVTANICLLAGVGLFVAQAQSTNTGNQLSAQAPLAGTLNKAKPLDTLSSTDVAVHVARLTGLQEATAVVNKADTVSAQIAVASTDDQVAVKPQIVGAGLKSKKDIKTHIVKDGETVTSVAAKYGVTPDTIRNSNGLSGDALQVGKELKISPVNGILYTVKAGDTPDTLASRYFANKDLLIAFNDAELTGNFKVGDMIVIPDGVQPSAPAPARRAAVGYGFSFGSAAVYGSNGYDYGWCTWHAANRRMQIGRPIPANLGNAISWLSVARRAGLPTGGTPAAGAVLYHKNIGGLGHVAFVEKMNDDGSMLVSDMNYPTWGRVTYRTVPPSEFGNYAFIY